MAKFTGDRLEQARATADALLDELELGSAPIMHSLLKAKRLARLMQDEDAQTWLDLEARGYPKGFTFGQLGSCEHYARAGGRITDDNRYYFNSLPRFEADFDASRLSLENIRFPANFAPSVSSSNPHEITGLSLSGSIMTLTTKYNEMLAAATKQYSHNASIFNGLKSAIHSYATDCHHALALSDAAQNLFEKARNHVDTFVRAVAPKAAGQMAAAFDRFDSGEPEALSHALTSCRRLLQTVADAVFPPQIEPFVDSKGKSRKVGPDEYKNRLLAFFDSKLTSTSTGAMAQAELDGLASRVDALYEKACKGVHADVTVGEVRLVLISVYLLLAEIVRLAEANTPPQGDTAAAAIGPPEDEL